MIPVLGCLVLVLAVVVAAGTAAGAVTAPTEPGLSAAPGQVLTDGQAGLTAGVPGRDGAALSARPCTSPCSPSSDVSQGQYPTGVGLTSGQSGDATADDASASGAPATSADGQFGKHTSAFGGPSGGTYASSGCLSVVSIIPAPLPLNGTGTSCANPATAGTGGAGSGAGSGGAAGAGGAGTAGSGAARNGAGGSSGGSGEGGSNAATCPTSAAGLALPAGGNSPVALLTVALLALGAGYLMSAARRRYAL